MNAENEEKMTKTCLKI